MLEKLFLEFVLTKNYCQIISDWKNLSFSELNLFQLRKIYMFSVLFNVLIIKTVSHRPGREPKLL